MIYRNSQQELCYESILEFLEIEVTLCDIGRSAKTFQEIDDLVRDYFQLFPVKEAR